MVKKVDWKCLKIDGNVSAEYERRVQEDLAKVRGVDKYVTPELGKLKINWILNKCTKRAFQKIIEPDKAAVIEELIQRV